MNRLIWILTIWLGAVFPCLGIPTAHADEPIFPLIWIRIVGDGQNDLKTDAHITLSPALKTDRATTTATTARFISVPVEMKVRGGGSFIARILFRHPTYGMIEPDYLKGNRESTNLAYQVIHKLQGYHAFEFTLKIPVVPEN